MASERPLRILSLDGGGVKGLASLHILKQLMAQVQRQQRASGIGGSHGPLRPCDYFDLICGTSTGGLIAIMLGRLKYVSSKIRKRGFVLFCFPFFFFFLQAWSNCCRISKLQLTNTVCFRRKSLLPHLPILKPYSIMLC
jgi:hypothetical protein